MRHWSRKTPLNIKVVSFLKLSYFHRIFTNTLLNTNVNRTLSTLKNLQNLWIFSTLYTVHGSALFQYFGAMFWIMIVTLCNVQYVVFHDLFPAFVGIIKKIVAFLFVNDFPYSEIVNQIYKTQDIIHISSFMHYYIINRGINIW